MKYSFAVIFCLLSANFVFAEEKIDINTAPIEDLIKIIHIGDVRAAELISLRPFSSVGELTKIKGIGEARLRDIKNQGLVWVTPAAENSSPLIQEPANVGFPPAANETQSDRVSSTESGSPQTLTEYPEGVVINEILPSPIGADEEEEWIEIFNKNNFEINLSGWKISDVAGKIEVYIFPEETIISSNGFLVLYRPTTKITLNNQGDGLRLIQPNENIIDEVNYENAPRGESYSRFGSSWAWTSTLTPGGTNVQETPAVSVKPGLTENAPQEQLAAAGGVILDLSQNKNPLESSYTLLAVIVLTAVLGIVIFTLKR